MSERIVPFATAAGIGIPVPMPCPFLYPQTKTVTARWFDDVIVSSSVNTTIALR